MAYQDYKVLRIELKSNGVCIATISGDETNLMDMAMLGELDRFTKQVETDDSVRVVVVRSANEGFWISHFDVTQIISIKIDKPAKRFDQVRGIQAMCERVRLMGKPTIAEVAGRVGGGGCEFASGFDMRFGVHGRTVVSNQEVGLGVLAGGTGTVRWPQMAGRGRAMEVLLGCVELDAKTAAEWGWLNRAFDDAESCSKYVDWLADRMAALPREALKVTKQSVNFNAMRPYQNEALTEEQYLFQVLTRTDDAQQLMKRFIAKGGQTLAVESKPDALLDSKL